MIVTCRPVCSANAVIPMPPYPPAWGGVAAAFATAHPPQPPKENLEKDPSHGR